jgi:hypothetical protein
MIIREKNARNFWRKLIEEQRPLIIVLRDTLSNYYQEQASFNAVISDRMDWVG